MSVSSTTTLPAQPTTGAVSFKALGGDGFYAPIGMYQLESIGVVNDASGGTAQLFINMDPQFQAVVQNMVFNIASAAADKECVCAIASRDLNYSDVGQFIALLPTITGVTNARASWCPVPLFDCGQINGVVANVDTETFSVSAQILLFNRRATEIIPLSILNASLTRSASLIT